MRNWKPCSNLEESGWSVISFQAVIFDLDGLLLDSERIALDAFNETCRHFDIEDLNGLFLKCVGTSQALGEKILMEGLPSHIDFSSFSSTWYENYKARIRNNPVPLKDGALDLLEYLSSRQVSSAVATSSKTERAVEKLRDAGILHFFKVVVGGDQVQRSKPAPDTFLRAAELMAVDPGKCLALEDSENGVRSAVAAGMTVIQIPDLVPPSRSLIELGHTIAGSLNDVRIWLGDGQ